MLLKGIRYDIIKQVQFSASCDVSQDNKRKVTLNKKELHESMSRGEKTGLTSFGVDL